MKVTRRFAWAFLLLVGGCGSATLVRDAGTDATGETGGSGGSAAAAGHAGSGGAGAQAGAGGGLAGVGGSAAPLGGAGGTSSSGGSKAGAGTSGTAGAGGTGGSGGAAGTGGTTGSAGAGGTATCSNTASDAANCGACGHSCLGGTCSSGICQPFTLGTVMVLTGNSEFPVKTSVSGGHVYVGTQVGRGGGNIWQLDANAPSTPVQVAGAPSYANVGCVMGGQVFFLDYSTSPSSISSCELANCTTTYVQIVTANSGAPACDVMNNELVWTSSADGAQYTVYRASPTGANLRPVTSFSISQDSASWSVVGFPPDVTDRVFYTRVDSTAGTSSLYYISTTSNNTSGVLVVTFSGVFASGGLWANDTTVIFSGENASAASEIFQAPLPNGILSGTLPIFLDGDSNGAAVDQANFYGTVALNSTIPSDALIRCPLSGCNSPIVISRGQAGANSFAQDAQSIYWTTISAPGGGVTDSFTVWKAAK